MGRQRTALTPQVIERVCFYTKQGYSMADICTETGVSPSTVQRAKHILFKEKRLKPCGMGRPPKTQTVDQTDFTEDGEDFFDLVTENVNLSVRRKNKILLLNALIASCERNLKNAQENLKWMKEWINELREAEDGNSG